MNVNMNAAYKRKAVSQDDNIEIPAKRKRSSGNNTIEISDEEGPKVVKVRKRGRPRKRTKSVTSDSTPKKTPEE